MYNPCHTPLSHYRQIIDYNILLIKEIKVHKENNNFTLNLTLLLFSLHNEFINRKQKHLLDNNCSNQRPNALTDRLKAVFWGLGGKVCADGECCNSWHQCGVVSPAGATERSAGGHSIRRPRPADCSWTILQLKLPNKTTHLICSLTAFTSASLALFLSGVTYILQHNSSGWNSPVLTDLSTTGMSSLSSLAPFSLSMHVSRPPCDCARLSPGSHRSWCMTRTVGKALFSVNL